MSDPHDSPTDTATVSARAKAGDSEALATLGRKGASVRWERARQRKAEHAAQIALSTVAERQRVLADQVAQLQASGVDDAKKTQALVAAIRELNNMDGFDALAREVETLRAEVTAYRASHATAQAIVLRWHDGTPIAPPLRIVPPVEAAE